MDSKTLGELVRSYRKQQCLTQAQLASKSNTGKRFISELENGKTTLQIGKVMHVLYQLKLDLQIIPLNSDIV